MDGRTEPVRNPRTLQGIRLSASGRLNETDEMMRDRIRGLLRELRHSIAGILGAAAVFMFPMDASALAASTVLLGVSALGWHRLLRRSPERELLDMDLADLRSNYRWSTIVQLVPPAIFAVSAYYHLGAAFYPYGYAFLAGAILTSVPPIGMMLRARQLGRLSPADQELALPEESGRPVTADSSTLGQRPRGPDESPAARVP